MSIEENVALVRRNIASAAAEAMLRLSLIHI